MSPFGFAAALLLGAIAAVPALAPARAAPLLRAAPLPRVASINLCTDQLVLALADDAQVVGLSPYARDAGRSAGAAGAAGFRRLSGGAEELVVDRPDVVLAGPFTNRATRALLRAEGLAVEDFAVPSSLDEARAQVLRAGALLGQPARAATIDAALGAALERARAAAAKRPGPAPTVLPLQRRGWVEGGTSLLGSLMDAAGLASAAPALGLPAGGMARLEAVVALRPDLLLVGGGEGAPDQGRALLLHPALARLYPPARRLALPEGAALCAGPALAAALDALVAQADAAAAR